MSERAESLRKRVQMAHHSRADVIIGKNGITPSLIKEIDRRLEQKEVVKIKILRSGVEVEDTDRREIARRVARLLNARLMGVRGRTFVLYRKRESGGQPTTNSTYPTRQLAYKPGRKPR
ncbi:MAG: YhbY family RNA-binding protein [Desulfurococcales archaeon]|nr:YhbY family RNA-binding protein [Desulfurococcales archaeon]